MLPGEKISGLKRISKAVSLMEPTALQAFRTTSRLLGSVCVWDQRQKNKKINKNTEMLKVITSDRSCQNV